MSSNRDRYGRRKVQPKISFRFRNIIIIFVLCILVGLICYMIRINL
ncbi:MAG: hypothetical protein ACI4JN_12730 [Ruminococcus sp.]